MLKTYQLKEVTIVQYQKTLERTAADNQQMRAIIEAGTQGKMEQGTSSIESKMTLPTDSNERKEYPLFRGVLRYFPAALAGIANISKRGNDKHNPGEEMHHARNKSPDQADCIVRHLVDIEDLLAAQTRGDNTITKEAILIEVNQMAWRALAFSQEIHEKLGAPMAPGAKK